MLVVQLGGIGDFVLTSAFLRELSRSENAKITLVVRPSVRQLAELCPYADRVLAFDIHRSRLAGALSGLLRSRRFVKENAIGEYRSAWNARFDVDDYGATFIMHWSRSERRIGYSELATPCKELRDKGYDELLTDVVLPPDDTGQHEADRLLELLRIAGIEVADRGLELWLGPEDRTAAQAIRADQGQRPAIALGIGAGHAKRRWPADRFAHLADRLHEEHGTVAVLVGSPAEDLETATAISSAANSPVVNAVGRLSLRGTAALLEKCDMYVGNDSGLMHVAAAANLPVVEISCHPQGGDPAHSNSPARFGPHGVPSVVLRPLRPASSACASGCESENAHCIKGVSAQDTLGAALELLTPRPLSRG